MDIFDRISIFIWYFVSAMMLYVSARGLDKCYGTDYISDIAIIFLISCTISRIVILEEQNKKHKEE